MDDSSTCIMFYTLMDSGTMNGTNRMTNRVKQLSDRFGQTWTFNIPLLRVGLGAVNKPPTVIWHVEESQKEGKTVRLDQPTTDCDINVNRCRR